MQHVTKFDTRDSQTVVRPFAALAAHIAACDRKRAAGLRQTAAARKANRKG